MYVSMSVSMCVCVCVPLMISKWDDVFYSRHIAHSHTTHESVRCCFLMAKIGNTHQCLRSSMNEYDGIVNIKSRICAVDLGYGKWAMQRAARIHCITLFVETTICEERGRENFPSRKWLRLSNRNYVRSHSSHAYIVFECLRAGIPRAFGAHSHPINIHFGEWAMWCCGCECGGEHARGHISNRKS